jgi:hypothetical protein
MLLYYKLQYFAIPENNNEPGNKKAVKETVLNILTTLTGWGEDMQSEIVYAYIYYL